MAWTDPMTAVANTVFTAAEYNTHIRSNFAELAPQVAETPGYTFVYDNFNDSVVEVDPRLLFVYPGRNIKSYSETPGCLVERNVNAGIATMPQFITIGFTRSVRNDYDMWVSGTTITIKKSGTYMVGAHGQFATNASGNARWLHISKGDVIMVRERADPGSDQPGIELSAVIPCVVGDEITLAAQQDSGGALNLLGSFASPIALYAYYLRAGGSAF